MTSHSTTAELFNAESNKLLEQSLVKIRNCLDQLTDDQIWWRPEEPLNSIGNLMMHLAGNLRQWTVVGVGGLPDDRDRDSEFAQRDLISKGELFERLSGTVDQAKQMIAALGDQQLTESRTIQEFEVTVLGAVCHTTSHFVGHTHQIIYITRLILGDRYQFQWSPATERRDVPI